MENSSQLQRTEQVITGEKTRTAKIVLLNPPTRNGIAVVRDTFYGCWCKGRADYNCWSYFKERRIPSKFSGWHGYEMGCLSNS